MSRYEFFCLPILVSLKGNMLKLLQAKCLRFRPLGKHNKDRHPVGTSKGGLRVRGIR